MRSYHNSYSRVNVIDSISYINKQFININSNKSTIVHWSSKVKSFDPSSFPAVLVSLIKLTGQRPSVTKASKGVAQLGIRKDMRTGIKISIRGSNRYRIITQKN